MCGIAGIMSADGSEPSAEVLRRLASNLAHRGPDGQGFYVGADVGLTQTRLAIIDLTTGDQPMFLEQDGDSGSLAMVANGEIYNYVELRAATPEKDYKSQSDCESILHLYQDYGVDFAEHLRGMYAIAIHDPSDGALVLARDPFGIKPLYYSVAPDGFVFASEPQALVSIGLVTPRVIDTRRDELLSLQFTTGAETAIEGIYRVLPGETLVIREGRIASRKRVSALPPGKPRREADEEALREFDRVMTESVSIHQRSDVPYGMFLSGGIDSSVLLAFMKQLNPAPVHAICAGFPETDVHDERAHAREVAKACGAAFDEVAITSKTFWDDLPAIAAAVDDPVADYAIVPTFILARHAAKAGLKVVLSGEGGDELFAGYGRYRRAIRPRILGGRDMRHKAIMAGLGVLREEPNRWRDGIEAAQREENGYGRTRLQAIQAMDCVDWLPHDLLIKLDRCLMAHGVEGRVPFLDPFVAEFAFRLPDRLKVHRRTGKWLLRKWLDTALPVAKPFAHKRGFTVPVGAWISEQADKIGPLVAGQPGIVEACEPDHVRALFKAGPEQGKAQWTLLFYALWHQRHILGVAPEVDVFEFLANAA